jgi:Lipoprotein NlpI, contains TPR repeats
LDKEHENARLLYLKGLAYKGLLKYPEAIYAFESAFRLDTSNYQVAGELGTCCKLIGNYTSALEAFDKASRLSPENCQFKMEMAGILVQLELYRNALGVYLSIYQRDSVNIFLLRNIAKTYDNLEMTDSAGFYYEKALALYPHDFQTVFRLGNICIKQKKYVKTIDITGNYQQFDSKNIKINRLNAYAIYLTEDYRLAAKRFILCIQNCDTFDFSYKYLGLSYFKMEKYDSAKLFLAKSFQKDSLNVQTCYAIGIACKFLNQDMESIAYLSKTLELVRPAPKFESEVLQNLAETYNSSNSYSKGLQSLLSAYRVTPADTLLKFRIARQYDSYLNNRKLALTYYKEFLKTRPKQKTRGKELPFALSYYDTVEKRIRQLSRKP